MPLPFYQVDVFTNKKYSGNQLAVIRSANVLSDDEMLQITREMNYSETTFILSDEPRNGGYDVRIFTPGGEVPFAGHPTLGTAYIIQREIHHGQPGRIILNLAVGQIPVDISYRNDSADFLMMQQKQPVFGGKYEIRRIAEALNINPEEIRRDFPIQSVSTGLPFVIVPLVNMTAVKSAHINRNKYFSLFRSRDTAQSILVFSAEPYSTQNDLNVRVFPENHGITEDPATGSGNGCLAGYLLKHRYFHESSIKVRVEQGYEMNRPSLLLLEAREAGDAIDIRVGGGVVMVARGELE
jgi:trans-2,3-dihydro-3-hydroxyanthranilate isomerase